MPRLKTERAVVVAWDAFPYQDVAWIESRDGKKRPSWRKVTVLRKLGEKLILSASTGRTLTICKLVLVHVEGERRPRVIDIDRLRGGRSTDVHGDR